MTARDAIDRSISTDSIVTLDYDYYVLAQLESACEDSVEAFGVTEFWGCDDDGNDWRVHMRDEA